MPLSKGKYLVLGIFSALVLAALWLALLIFSAPLKSAPAELSTRDWLNNGMIIGKIYSHCRENRVRSERRVLRINESLAESLVKLAENGEGLLKVLGWIDMDNKNLHPYRFAYQNGKIKFKVQLSEPWHNWCLVVSGRADLQLEKSSEQLDFQELRIGNLPLPGFVRELFAGKIIEAMRRDEYYLQVRKVVESLKINKDNSLEIVYYPWELKKQLNI